VFGRHLETQQPRFDRSVVQSMCAPCFELEFAPERRVAGEYAGAPADKMLAQQLAELRIQPLECGDFAKPFAVRWIDQAASPALRAHARLRAAGK